MPITVKNYISLEGISKMDLFRDDVFYSNGEKKTRRELDFNKIIPMPKKLDVEHSLLEEMQLMYYLTDGCIYSEEKYADYIRPVDLEFLDERVYPLGLYRMTKEHIKKMPEFEKQIFFNDGEKIMDNITKYGCMDWYEWRLQNWNTIWNASDTKFISDHEISFSTPDAAPWPVVETLLKSLPINGALYRFYPEQYSELAYVDAQELNIAVADGKLHFKHKKKLERRDLYFIYQEYDEEPANPQRKSPHTNENIDRVYFRVDSDLKGAFQTLCKKKNVKFAKAIRGMIQAAIDQEGIPEGMLEEYPNPYNTSRFYVHTNIKLPKTMRKSFEAIARENGVSMNHLVVKYMEMCLAGNRIYYLDTP